MNQVLKFNDEIQARAALSDLFLTDSESGGAWDTSVCIPNIRVWAENEDGTRTFVDGWFIRVAIETGIEPYDTTGLEAEPIFA